MTGPSWAALAVVALAVLAVVVTVRTARRPTAPVADLETYFDRWSALHGGYDPRTGFWTRHWLRLAHAVARPLAWRGVQPDALTGWGLVVGAAVAATAVPGGRWPLLGVALIVASGLLDNLDGAVAVMTGRSSRFGYVLDSVVDRCSDALYLVALGMLGAPAELVAVALFLMMLQEYVRARAGAAGMSEIGVVSVWERPTRVVLTAFLLLGAGLFPDRADDVAAWGALGWVVFGLIGTAQVLGAVRRGLTQAPPAPPRSPR